MAGRFPENVTLFLDDMDKKSLLTQL